MFDIDEFKSIASTSDQYNRRITYLQGKKIETQSIEKTVLEANSNLREGFKSFVIYGEPQSGKTEMMIALTAKLLDEGYKLIIILLNDNVRLLNQNLVRFQKSGISPSPKRFDEVLDEEIGTRPWVIFCKKNNANLKKLKDKLRNCSKKIIIDDEADYATPNSKINKEELSKINGSIYTLLDQEDGGCYIGVTATPARLDLNNTYNNLTERWVKFSPHSKYVGKDVFFPFGQSEKLEYKLELLPDAGDNPSYLRKALFSFLVNVALLNIDNNEKQNYAFLVHTSGKNEDQDKDHKEILKVFETLANPDHKNFEKYVKLIHDIASKSNKDAKKITKYVLENKNSRSIILLNSISGRSDDPTADPNDPTAQFTIFIGGNIVSRGVTFNNLLSMFFTRDVKHKLQQDTYIQRARMFGNRGKYINFFELWIPEKLYNDWNRCFIYHHLALEAIETTNKAPVWIADSRIQPAANTSIDKTTLSIDSGEMGFGMFKYNEKIEKVKDLKDPLEALRKINILVNSEVIPDYIIRFINHYMKNSSDIHIHSRSYSGRGTGVDEDTLLRKKGHFGSTEIQQYPHAVHHILIYRSHRTGMARAFYKFTGNVRYMRTIQRI